MPVDHTERGFEQAIQDHLLAHGYERGDPANFRAGLALDPDTLIRFFEDTQPKEWAKLSGLYGIEVEDRVIQRVAESLDQRGMLDCLRHGVTDRGVKLRLAHFRPATAMNPETLDLYGKNILTIARQVHFSEKRPGLSVDVLLSLNGLPIATAELKNPFTGQRVEHARTQYRQDRDPAEPLFRFKSRALVHFAVDPDEVSMTTRLTGKETSFLPFNKGREGGKGNPDNPDSGWKTAYLWEEVWERHSLLDILARFVHLAIEEKFKAGKKVRKESIVFPRYHQLDAVRNLLTAAKAEGPGFNYLIQHSAGSGKSNTIAWLAHRLASLHDAQDKLVFDAIIVITDRRVLDKQLQDTIYQFEHKQGVVQKIDDDSAQLAGALSAGTRIIITTLQKFSFVLDKIKTLPSRKYALIVDEAHSSQTGESAGNLRRVLAASPTEGTDDQETPDAPDAEDEILKAINARGPQANLSFFAFTATPKHKTLEMFGRDGADGRPIPFHLYSMRQAIEEGFILDVLKNYTTYKTYYRLAKAVEEDPEVDRVKATNAIARFVSLHPHNLAQKTEVMVEHFRNFTARQIGGRAKAMVVTRSRLHAVRYKREFDKYLKEKGYSNIRALVAFSGTVNDGDEWTEAKLNGFGERQLPERFDTDEYQLLIVAEKYQTGFDQPLLHTMYVDKKLDGLQAVQTLSRLNRICPGKEDTFVLDFVNEAEEVQEAFRPYYERTRIEERVDPNTLYSLKDRLDNFQIYWLQEVEDFAKVFFKPTGQQQERDKGLLHKCVDPAAARFSGEPEERRGDFRHQLGTFLRLYSFISQLINFGDVELEKLYAFGRLLITKLRVDEDGGPLVLDDDVTLAYYRLTRTHEGSLSLPSGESATVSGPTDVGTGRSKEDDRVRLSEIVDVLNQRFSTEFSKEDQLYFDQIVGDLKNDDRLGDQARNNTIDQFRLAFDPKGMAAFLSRMDRNESITNQFMANEELRETALELMMKQVYEHFQGLPPLPIEAPPIIGSELGM